MRAVRNTDRGIAVVEAPAPEGLTEQVRDLLPDDPGARVRVHAAGICGSDLHMLSFGPSPVTLGHEFAGVLDDGTPVAVEPLVTSRAADRDGTYAASPDTSVIGVAHDGGMADEIFVPRRSLVMLPPNVTPADACLAEVAAVGVRGLSRIGLESGMRVAVVGGGAIGLCAAAVARARGCDVDIVARHEPQRVAAERLGLGEADGDGYDVVIEAAGTVSGIERSVELARREGTVLLLGVYWDGMTWPGFAVLEKQLQITASVTYGRNAAGRDIDAAVALLAGAPELASAVITHRFPLDEAHRAFEVAADRASGAIKVVLEP
jgi:2-desacetyl-2-hydroxyethyl bacteriochlorophyllide A dehydrogenase